MQKPIDIMDSVHDEAIECFLASTREKDPVKKRYWEKRSELANRKFIIAAERVLYGKKP